MSWRLVSWNVAGRVQRLTDQAAVVLTEEPDVVALQEVTRTTLPLWRQALASTGLVHTLCPLDAGPPPRPRRLAVLLAAREPIEPVPPVPDLVWPERLISGLVHGAEVLCAHSPISPAPDLAKVRYHEAVAAHLAATDGPRVLCGDLNTPRRELSDGSVLTFAHTTTGKVREDRGERWAAAERMLVHGLVAEHGWTDAFRALHGRDTVARTWAWPNGGGYRLDHVLLSSGLTPVSFEYRHEWRRSGLSDHSGAVAEISS